MSQEDSALLCFYANKVSPNWHLISGDMQVLMVLSFA